MLQGIYFKFLFAPLMLNLKTILLFQYGKVKYFSILSWHMKIATEENKNVRAIEISEFLIATAL